MSDSAISFYIWGVISFLSPTLLLILRLLRIIDEQNAEILKLREQNERTRTD